MNLPSSVGFAPMPNPIDNELFVFDLEQNPVVAHPQTVLWGKICQSLDLSLQIVAHFLNSCKKVRPHPRG